MKKFDIPVIYRSPLITAIKNKRRQSDKLKKDFSPSFLDFGDVQIYLARHFGFCYGVENAIEISFRTIDENPGKKIYLLSEMIHNPHVNNDLKDRGVEFLMDTKGNTLIPFENLSPGDIVVVPAFGTTLEIESKLKAIGVEIEQYNTTCPFVEKVWNRAQVIAKNQYSIVLHGKPQHEETRATFSHSALHSPTVVVKDMQEAIALSAYILGTTDAEKFYTQFAGQYSEGFNVSRDLQRIGVVNQTAIHFVMQLTRTREQSTDCWKRMRILPSWLVVTIVPTRRTSLNYARKNYPLILFVRKMKLFLQKK